MNEHDEKPTALPVPRRRRWVAVVLALTIFLSGAVLGAGAAVIVIVQGARHALRHPEETPRRAAARLERRLNLTAGQKQRIQAILTERHAALLAIRREVTPDVIRQLEQMHEQIGAVLDEKQRPRWDRMYGELAAPWRIPYAPPTTNER